jgi:SnoaL-like domain
LGYDRGMTVHDHFAAHEVIHRWWFNYDEGKLDVIARMLTADCHTSSRTELGQHPHEEFIRGDNRGHDDVMAWTKKHRAGSPYPLRHNATNIHVVAERGDELTLDSYLFVTQIVERKPSPLSSGIVHWVLVLTKSGYRVREKHVVLDSIESAPFQQVDFVSGRQATW